MYKWFVNGVDVNRNSKYLDYFFVDGDYDVTCAAWYDVPDCSPCNRTTMVPVTIQSTNSSFACAVLWQLLRALCSSTKPPPICALKLKKTKLHELILKLQIWFYFYRKCRRRFSRF